MAPKSGLAQTRNCAEGCQRTVALRVAAPLPTRMGWKRSNALRVPDPRSVGCGCGALGSPEQIAPAGALTDRILFGEELIEEVSNSQTRESFNCESGLMMDLFGVGGQGRAKAAQVVDRSRATNNSAHRHSLAAHQG